MRQVAQDYVAAEERSEAATGGEAVAKTENPNRIPQRIALDRRLASLLSGYAKRVKHYYFLLASAAIKAGS